MSIKEFLFLNIRRFIFSIVIILLGPVYVYMDYVHRYSDFMYILYPSYLKYITTDPVPILLLAFTTTSGLCLMCTNWLKVRYNWLYSYVTIISIVLFIIALFASFLTQIGYVPGGWDYSFDVKNFDERRSFEIGAAISFFLSESACEDFNDLYDSTGVNPLKIKQNDPGSVKVLISALQDGIYYKNHKYGPYLHNNSSLTDSEYWTPRTTKNGKGYRIEIYKSGQETRVVINPPTGPLTNQIITKVEDKVICTPVLDESEAVILIN